MKEKVKTNEHIYVFIILIVLKKNMRLVLIRVEHSPAIQLKNNITDNTSKYLVGCRFGTWVNSCKNSIKNGCI
jgi:hypothetical protein